ncbi:MAG TPA: helix-turn-helix transcriptional regulator [Terriglobia bacterium]|nr:helix-turn-helix transcriptional regulator [Terriglobia bacterium]
MHIGKRLRILREAKGLSQGDIERRSGLLRSYISRVEGGYTAPSLVTLEKFAKALGVESYQLLFPDHGRPKSPRIPAQIARSRPLKRLTKLYEGMSSSDRRLLLMLAAKLSKE